MKIIISTSIFILLCLNVSIGQSVKAVGRHSVVDGAVLIPLHPQSPGGAVYDKSPQISVKDSVKILRDSLMYFRKSITSNTDNTYMITKLSNENKKLKNELVKMKLKADSESFFGYNRENNINILMIIAGIILSIIAYLSLKNKLFANINMKSFAMLISGKNKKEHIVVPKITVDQIKFDYGDLPVQSQYCQEINGIQSNKERCQTVENNLQKSFSNISYLQSKKGNNNSDWFVVGASSIGKSHITSKKPCQDNHYCANIKSGWGIAVSCDGAGSADNSEKGSLFVSKTTFEVFKGFLEENKLVNEKYLPKENQWQEISNKAFLSVYELLYEYAEKEKVEFNSLACTAIVVVFTPIGLLSAHIGDGRAGYCNENGEWKSLITPHKGEEANQTIFLTSSPWVNDSDFQMSGVKVPESKVINERAIAFTLMSDGCEAHSFECSKMDIDANKWIDPNEPSGKFFNPLMAQLKSMNDNEVSFDDVKISWIKFVEEGVQGLKDEPDDKTLIFGILL